MAIILVAVAGIGYAAFTSIFNKVNTKTCTSCEIGGKGLNILVIGSDSRRGLTAAQKKDLHVGSDSGERSDTMILLHIPAGGGKADMVSLPRDSYVKIPAHCSNGALPSRSGTCAKGGTLVGASMNKLNAAYSFGGADLAVKTVEANTGVPITHYIEINFLGFVNMVNRLGGVPICTATAINDPVRRNPSGSGYIGSGLELKAGTSTLHGTQALEYVRAREFDPAQGDLGRVQRQQKFMAALLDKAESAGVLLNLPKLYGFLKSVAGSLTVDKGLSRGQMFHLARTLHSMSPKNVNLLTVPLSDTNLATPVGSSVLWDPVLSKRLFRDFIADRPITNIIASQRLTVPPSDITVRVLNATSTSGQAATVSQALQAVGFVAGSTGDAPAGTDRTTTVVLYGPSRSQSATTVAAAVPGAAKREVSSLGHKVELIVGTNYKGVKKVKVSGTTHKSTVTTGASNPCS
jgi:LCP family protein required for cell wall assembly